MNNLEWIPYFILHIGVYQAGIKKNKIGWLIQGIASLIIVFLSAYFRIWGLTFINTVFSIAFFNIYRKTKN